MKQCEGLGELKTFDTQSVRLCSWKGGFARVRKGHTPQDHLPEEEWRGGRKGRRTPFGHKRAPLTLTPAWSCSLLTP